MRAPPRKLPHFANECAAQVGLRAMRALHVAAPRPLTAMRVGRAGSEISARPRQRCWAGRLPHRHPTAVGRAAPSRPVRPQQERIERTLGASNRHAERQSGMEHWVTRRQVVAYYAQPKNPETGKSCVGVCYLGCTYESIEPEWRGFVAGHGRRRGRRACAAAHQAWL